MDEWEWKLCEVADQGRGLLAVEVEFIEKMIDESDDPEWEPSPRQQERILNIHESRVK